MNLRAVLTSLAGKGRLIPLYFTELIYAELISVSAGYGVQDPDAEGRNIETEFSLGPLLVLLRCCS